MFSKIIKISLEAKIYIYWCQETISCFHNNFFIIINLVRGNLVFYQIYIKQYSKMIKISLKTKKIKIIIIK